MATTTPRIGLTKPDLTDLVDVGVLNTNFDKIDSNIASTKIQATKPTTANSGDLWWDSDTGTLYVYYVGASSSSWVAATSDPINIGVVANQTERDAQYPTPAQGMSVWRQDLGAQETYYGLYNSSTNPGGRDSSGWYTTNRAGGLIPVKPSSVVVVSGTGTANALGEVSVTNATSISLNGVFSAEAQKYLIIGHGKLAAVGDIQARWRASGTDGTANYDGIGWYSNTTTLSNYYRPSTSNHEVAYVTSTSNGYVSFTVNAFRPYGTDMKLLSTSSFTDHGWAIEQRTRYGTTSTQFDGITFIIAGTTFTGTFQVFAYND